jgi:hypothetical protein
MVTVSANFKKALTILGIVVLVYYVVTQPTGAGSFVQQLVGIVQSFGEAFVSFLRSVFV